MGRRVATGEDRRNPINSRIRDGLRERLAAAAQDQGRTLSHEIEDRLERSFRDEDLISVLIGGQRTKAALSIIAAVLKMSKTSQGKSWEDDAAVANAVGVAINRLITQISGECIEATELLRAHPELERGITYAGQLIANYAILSYKAEFDAEVMVGREGAIAPPEAIERFVVNREKF